MTDSLDSHNLSAEVQEQAAVAVQEGCRSRREQAVVASPERYRLREAQAAALVEREVSAQPAAVPSQRAAAVAVAGPAEPRGRSPRAATPPAGYDEAWAPPSGSLNTEPCAWDATGSYRSLRHVDGLDVGEFLDAVVT